MSENEYPIAKEASDDELASLLARRTTRGRAKSTTVMIAILLVLLGVLIGVPLGRASAPIPIPATTEGTGAATFSESG